jgi:hypothetical protein
MSTADPLRTLDGEAHGNQWMPVIADRTGITDRTTKLSANAFLFSFADVASRGVVRWIALSRKFERGLSPLVGLLDLEGASLEAHLAQVGIGFEMLGYDLLIEAGAAKKRAKDANFEVQVRAVLAQVADLLPFDAERFPPLLRRTYVGVKHADRDRPGWDEMHLAYRQSIQVFRAWVAMRLGVSKRRLKDALEYDAVTSHIARAMEQGQGRT